MKDLRDLDHLRDLRAEMLLWGGIEPDRFNGIFAMPVKGSKRPLRIIASSGGGPGSFGWDHVSVSLPARCPTWAEMDLAKDTFFYSYEICVQLHVPHDKHISNHPYCLHLWRPVDQDMPLPPSVLVGIRQAGELNEQTAAALARRVAGLTGT